MLKQPIYVEFNLDAKVNNSKIIAISHVDDKYSETLEVAVKQNDRFVYMGGATVVAKMVLHREKDYLLSDSVPCTINANGNILIPFDNAVVKTRQGTVKIEVNITRDTDELTLQFPLWVSVNGSILDNAEVTPDSKGTIPELLEEAKEALDDATAALEQVGDYNNLENKPQISGVTLSGDKTPDELGLQKKLTAGDNVEIDADGRISAKDTNNYNELTDKPKFRFNSAIVNPVVGTLEWNPYEFVRVGNNINLHSNIFRSYLGFNEILYDFDSMNTHADFYHSGVYRFNKSNISNLPNEFVDAGEFIYVYHYMTSGKDDFIRKVVYETTEGVKAWIQLATLGAADASGNAPIVSASAWADLTNTGGSEIASGVVNQNGTISFYDAGGNLLFTTTGASVIGKDGINITNAEVDDDMHLIISLSNGEEIDAGRVGIPKIDIANAVVTLSTSEFIYDGNQKLPTIRSVELHGTTLVKNQDYVVVSPPETAIGDYLLIIQGIGDYMGTSSASWSIETQERYVFGVMWDYSLSSPQLTRLTPQNDPLAIVTNAPSQEPTACVGNDGNGQSDFDNYMPWKGMRRYNYIDGQIVDFVDYQSGETFIYIPEFWSKIVNDTTNSKMYFYISSAEMSTFIKHPGSGRYMSRYECNENFLSATGFMPKVNTSLTTFRTGITAVDDKHFQYDFSTYNALELLYIVEFAHLNSQAKIGAGITSGSAAQTTGQTDILTYHTGRVLGTDNLSAMQYRWIENLWGNIWTLIDGILIQDGLVYICEDPPKFSSSITNDYRNTGLIMPSQIQGWLKTESDYANSYLIPLSTNGSDSTYLCDIYVYGSGLRVFDVGGSYVNSSNAGLFCCGCPNPPDSTYITVGGRAVLIPGGES